MWSGGYFGEGEVFSAELFVADGAGVEAVVLVVVVELVVDEDRRLHFAGDAEGQGAVELAGGADCVIGYCHLDDVVGKHGHGDADS